MDLVTVPIVLILGAFLLFLICISRFLNVISSPLKHIPGPAYAAFTSLPLKYAFATGTMWNMTVSAHEQWGRVVRLGPRNVWTSDKDVIRDILVTRNLPKSSVYRDLARDYKSPGLFTENRYESHQQLRAILMPGFSLANVNNHESTYLNHTETLVKRWTELLNSRSGSIADGGVIVDMKREMNDLAWKVISEYCFGPNWKHDDAPTHTVSDCTEDCTDFSASRQIFDSLRQRWKTVFLRRILRRFGIEWSVTWPDTVTSAVDTVIRSRRSIDKGNQKDVLSILIDDSKVKENSMEMTRDTIDQMSELLMAGSESTAGRLTCLFLALVHNPEIKKRLFDSLGDPDHSSFVSSKDVATDTRYTYLNACIKETLRLYPASSDIARTTGRETLTVGQWVLPPRTSVSVSYRALHLDKEYWPQPYRFWPERWLNENERGDVPAALTTAYYPFSIGKHSCIGQGLAMAEMRVVAANILSRFGISEVLGQDLTFRQFMSLDIGKDSWKVILRSR